MIIGIDIGGTKISAALLSGSEILEQRSAPSCIHGDLEQLLPTIETLLGDWPDRARGIGVGSTGLIGNPDVHFLSAGPDKRLPLKHLLESTFGKPVLLLNDAWAAAWGEYKLGQHTQSETLVYVTVSTGIGGGVIQNGQLLTAPHGFAAHIGHLSVPRPEGGHIQCICGRTDCVEAIASGTAIASRATQLMGRAFSGKDVFDSLAEHSQLQDLVDDCATAIAEMMANVKALTGTEVVVLGGSVGLNPEFSSRVQKALTNLPDVYHMELRSPVLGAHADIVGAALALEESLNA